VQHLQQRDAHDRALERGDPVQRPSPRHAARSEVELLLVVRRRVGERAGEPGRVALEDVVERASGQLVL
jgi:hypothetical protein